MTDLTRTDSPSRHKVQPPTHEPSSWEAITRKDLLRRASGGAVLLGAGSLLAACGSSAPSASSTAAGANASSLKTVIVAAADTPQTLDSDKSVQLEGWEAVTSLYDTLVQYPYAAIVDHVRPSNISDLEGVRGQLASDFSISRDGKTTTFKLRNGVTSAAGNPLTTDDMKFFFGTMVAKATGIRALVTLLGNFDPKTDVKYIDKSTFSVTSRSPTPLFIPGLSLFVSSIFDSKLVAPHVTAADPTASAFIAKRAAGFGPYTLDTLVPGQQATYTAFDGYYGSKPPAKQIISRAVPNPSNRLSLIEQGAAQIGPGLAPRDLKQARTTANYGGNVMSWVYFNCQMAPFKDVNIRKALSFATPYEEILSTVYLGTAKRLYGPLPDSYPDNIGAQLNKYNHDPAMAKSYLTKAGMGGGINVNLFYNVAAPQVSQIALLLQAAWNAVGIKTTITALDSATFGTKKQNHQLPLWLDVDQADLPDMGYTSSIFFLKGGPANYGVYLNPTVDALTRKSISTLSKAERTQVGHQIQQIVIDEAPWIFLAQPGSHWAITQPVSVVPWVTNGGLIYSGIS
jgi:peptide/nickel transport system substrate-binding protein